MDQNSEIFKPNPDCETCEGTGAVAHPKGPEGNRELACPACNGGTVQEAASKGE